MNETKRSFTMDPNLLMHVIKRQAGSLAKAALEAVMNSIDAQCTECRIILDQETMCVTDDGHGFTTEEQIENYFERFGTPHEDGDATFGHFRLGRGQLFSFGRNVWVSGPYRMEVDIKRDGLDYTLTRQEPTPGCSIVVSLYDRLLPSLFEETRRQIKEYVRYSPTPVYLNDEKISIEPESVDWDLETDEAWFQFKDRGIFDIYNLGMFVTSHSSYNYGIGGVVVSKRAMQLNMARNQPDVTCETWQAIRKRLNAQGRTRQPSKRTTEAQRTALAKDVVAGEYDSRMINEDRLITDVCGRHITITSFLSTTLPVTVGEPGDQQLETIHRRKIAYVLAETTLHRFGMSSGRELVRLLDQVAIHPTLTRVTPEQVVDPESLRVLVSADHEGLDDKELSKRDLLALRAIRRGARELKYLDLVKKERTIKAGQSNVADAWTDGSGMIWINKDMLRRMNKGVAGAVWLMCLLVHEYTHDEQDTGSHVHDFEFFEAYHEATLESDPIIGKAALAAVIYYIDALNKAGLKPNKGLLKTADANDAYTEA